MATNSAEPRPLIPALAPLYAHAPDLSWLLVRLTAGLMLLPHGIPKIFTQGVAAFAAAGLARRGIEPSLPLAYWIAFLETIGGLLHRARPVHTFFRGGRCDRNGGHRLSQLRQRLRLDQWRLRISADVGTDHARHRAARRRAVFGGSEDREGVVRRDSGLCLKPLRVLGLCARRRRAQGSRGHTLSL